MWHAIHLPGMVFIQINLLAVIWDYISYFVFWTTENIGKIKVGILSLQHIYMSVVYLCKNSALFLLLSPWLQVVLSGAWQVGGMAERGDWKIVSTPKFMLISTRKTQAQIHHVLDIYFKILTGTKQYIHGCTGKLVWRTRGNLWHRPRTG